MSFVFRGSRADLKNGIPGFIPECRTVHFSASQRIHAARTVNSNSLAFLVTVLLFMILNSHQTSSNFLLWLVFGIFLLAHMNFITMSESQMKKGRQFSASSMQSASSSAAAEEKLDTAIAVGGLKTEDELTCTVCLEQVGETVRSFPCLHQFHANCIDPWLRQQGTCPVCKLKSTIWLA